MTEAVAGTWLERTVDAAVGIVNPRRAYLRAHFRRMERDPDYREGVEGILRASGYRKRAETSAPKSLAHVGSVGQDQRSADAVVLAQLRERRARARALKRDNAIAAGLLNNTPREVVGTGLSPQSMAPEEIRDALESVWAERRDQLFPAEGLGFRDHQELMAAKLLEDGEVWIKAAATDGSEPVWFETVEADRVQWPLGEYAKEKGGVIRDGIERDALGRITGYHIADWHPGDVAVPYTPAPGKHVPLTPDDFTFCTPDVARHLALKSRPGQSHGEPWLTPVDEDLAKLDLLIEASLKRMTMAACLAVFIQSELDLGGIVEVTAEDAGYEVDQAIKPGMIFKLAPGETVETLTPNFPVTDLTQFVQALARRVGTALGLSYLAVLSDASGYNYSSARTDLLRDRRLYRALQAKLISGYLQWLWESVLEDARLRGDPRLRGVTSAQIKAVRWICPGWEWVDPRNEAEAIGVKLGLRLTCLQDEAAALGKDWQELIRQQLVEEAFEAAERERLGLPPRVPLDPSAVTSTSVDDTVEDQDTEDQARSRRRLAA